MDGSIDENYAHEGLQLAANRLWQKEAVTKSSGNVVDATARFEERQWDQRHIWTPLFCKLFLFDCYDQ